MNGPDVVAKGCTHFPQISVWERKENPEAGTEVGTGLDRLRKKYQSQSRPLARAQTQTHMHTHTCAHHMDMGSDIFGAIQSRLNPEKSGGNVFVGRKRVLFGKIRIPSD